MPYPSRRQTVLLFAIVILLNLAVAVVSIFVGKYQIAPDEILALLMGGDTVAPMSAKVFFTLRLPRTVMAFLAGLGLGLAGSAYQVLFKNPLASPDIIGVAGGANLGAAVAVVMTSSSIPIMTLGAFWGGLAAVACVMLLVKATNSHSTSTYVLAGIVINAISKAMIMTLKYFADPENELAAMEYWEMGSFSNITQSKLLSILPMFLMGLIGLLLLRRQVQLMGLSDNECRALGVRLRPVRAAVLILSTLLVASIVSVTGLISFVGLIAPHTAKLMLRRNNSITLCLSGLTGGLVVMASDIFARTLYSAELPISILTTVTGVPLLLYFMCIKRGPHERNFFY
ncbi:MAG: iron ABC transporter permease [Fretibacterium sp.]|nr:iron ABC transporter permease [Fretibacterium sp.]